MGKREEVVSRRVRDVHLYMCQSSRIILVFMLLCVNMSQLLHSSYERHNLSIVVVVLKIVIR